MPGSYRLRFALFPWSLRLVMYSITLPVLSLCLSAPAGGPAHRLIGLGRYTMPMSTTHNVANYYHYGRLVSDRRTSFRPVLVLYLAVAQKQQYVDI